MLILKNETQFKIHTDLDINTSTWIVNKLFNKVKQGKIIFELQSKKGSLVNEFTINVVGGVFSAVLYDLIKYFYKLLKKQKEKTKGKNIEIKPIYIFTEKEQYIITGDKNSKLPKDLESLVDEKRDMG